MPGCKSCCCTTNLRYSCKAQAHSRGRSARQVLLGSAPQHATAVALCLARMLQLLLDSLLMQRLNTCNSDSLLHICTHACDTVDTLEQCSKADLQQFEHIAAAARSRSHTCSCCTPGAATPCGEVYWCWLCHTGQQQWQEQQQQMRAWGEPCKPSASLDTVV